MVVQALETSRFSPRIFLWGSERVCVGRRESLKHGGKIIVLGRMVDFNTVVDEKSMLGSLLNMCCIRSVLNMCCISVLRILVTAPVLLGSKGQS